jgi:hypothetical protein
LARYRQIHHEELTRFRTELRQHLDQQIAAQLYDGEAGARALEVARDVIVQRLKADPEVYREIAQRPRHWWQRRPSMTEVG